MPGETRIRYALHFFYRQKISLWDVIIRRSDIVKKEKSYFNHHTLISDNDVWCQLIIISKYVRIIRLFRYFQRFTSYNFLLFRMLCFSGSAPVVLVVWLVCFSGNTPIWVVCFSLYFITVEVYYNDGNEWNSWLFTQWKFYNIIAEILWRISTIDIHPENNNEAQ